MSTLHVAIQPPPSLSLVPPIPNPSPHPIPIRCAHRFSLTEVIRVLRKKLGSGNTRVLSVGLTLAETLVKNCHDPVHREMSSERFMAAVAKIARVSVRCGAGKAEQDLAVLAHWVG